MTRYGPFWSPTEPIPVLGRSLTRSKTNHGTSNPTVCLGMCLKLFAGVTNERALSRMRERACPLQNSVEAQSSDEGTV